MSTFVNLHKKSYEISAVDSRDVGCLGTAVKKQTETEMQGTAINEKNQEQPCSKGPSVSRQANTEYVTDPMQHIGKT
jgi:hypothetical protein